MYYDDEQQQNPNYEQKYNSINTIGGANPETVSLQIDNREIVKDVEMMFKGYEYDMTTEKPIQVSPPLMNQQAIQRFIMSLRIHTDKNIRLSAHTDEEIYNTMLPYALSINRFIAMNHKRFNMSKGDLTLIKMNMVNPVFANMKASSGGLHLNNLTQSTRVVQNTSTEAQKKGMFRRMVGF